MFRHDLKVLIGILITALLIAAVWHIFDLSFCKNGRTDIEICDSDSLTNTTTYSSNAFGNNSNNLQGQTRKITLSPFDPNTASDQQLLALGFSERQIQSMNRYRAKGGIYQTPEAIAYIPYMTKGQYDRLLPYVRIADGYRPAREFVTREQVYGSYYNRQGESANGANGESNANEGGSTNSASTYPKKITLSERVSLNDADSLTLQSVPGIGPYNARKIIALRERYGGFVSLSQLADIRSLPDTSYHYLFIADGGITRINLNTASFTTLQRHPYIGYNRAKKIDQYRRVKGTISSLSDLNLLEGFSPSEQERLEPYVTF